MEPVPSTKDRRQQVAPDRPTKLRVGATRDRVEAAAGALALMVLRSNEAGIVVITVALARS